MVREKLSSFLIAGTLIGFLFTLSGNLLADEAQSDEVIPMPLAGLLLNPEVPSGLRVSVVGYFGGSNLFLTEDHAKILDYSSAIKVVDKTHDASIYQSQCRSNYVDVIGELSRRKSGKLQIQKITQIKYAESGEDCYREELQ